MRIMGTEMKAIKNRSDRFAPTDPSPRIPERRNKPNTAAKMAMPVITPLIF